MCQRQLSHGRRWLLRFLGAGLFLLCITVARAGAADGDRIIDGVGPNGMALMMCWTAIDAAGATGNGVWLDARGFRSLSLHTAGIFVATVQMRVSNAPAIPVNTNHEMPIGADITAAALTTMTLPARWVKARVAVYVSGTVTAYLCMLAN